ncbi:MAG: flagellar hook-length control protein FliK [Gammaproteobacteria bacterium]|nr:flagellar hook-length control protein FliK [Gammaproteobacteria bacterium]
MSSDISGVKSGLPVSTASTSTGAARGADAEGADRFASVLDGQLEGEAATTSSAGSKTAAAAATGEPVEGVAGELLGDAFKLRASYLRWPEHTRIEVDEGLPSNDALIEVELLPLDEAADGAGSDSVSLLVDLEPLPSDAQPEILPVVGAPMNGVVQASALAMKPTGDDERSAVGFDNGHGARTATTSSALVADRVSTAAASGEGTDPGASPAALLDSAVLRRVHEDVALERQVLREVQTGAQQTAIGESATLQPGAGLRHGSTVAQPGPLPSVAPGSAQNPHGLSLEPSVGTDAWQDGLANRVLWLNGQAGKRAVIQLKPADLGPINVEISVKDDQASVHFAAQHAATREALEAALPRLREMLAGNGLELSRADISDPGAGNAGFAQRDDGGAGAQAGRDQAMRGTAGWSDDAARSADDRDAGLRVGPVRVTGSGLIDAFA